MYAVTHVNDVLLYITTPNQQGLWETQDTFLCKCRPLHSYISTSLHYVVFNSLRDNYLSPLISSRWLNFSWPLTLLSIPHPFLLSQLAGLWLCATILVEWFSHLGHDMGQFSPSLIYAQLLANLHSLLCWTCANQQPCEICPALREQERWDATGILSRGSPDHGYGWGQKFG